MIISKAKIINLNHYIPNEELKSVKYIGVKLTKEKIKALNENGFKGSIELGDTFLPKAIGPCTRFNTFGKTVVDKSEKS